MADLMRTSNPALRGAFGTGDVAYGAETMTISGAVNKTGMLVILCVATAAWTWNRFFGALEISPEEAMHRSRLPAMVGGIGGFIVAMVTIFKKEWAGVTAPIYALLEGLVLGGVSALLEMRFHGIAIQAVALTFGTLIAMLLAYRSGLIKVTDKLRLGIVGRDRRHRRLLLPAIHPGLLRHPFHHHQRLRRRSASASACWWWDRRAEPGARLRPDRKRRALSALPSTWSGTAPSP